MIEIIKENLVIIVPALVAVILVLWWFSKSSIGGAENNVKYTQRNDPNAQNSYDQGRKGEKPLTLKKKLELSWQFLYEITDIVLAKFSAADQESALNIGKTLLENGGHYEHVIDYGIKHNLGRAESKGVAKSV